MKLDKLYSRTSTGAIQEWSVVIDGDSYYTVSGQIDGKKVTSKPTKCAGKNIGRANETSPQEQAESEALSKWEKKAKTGYTKDISSIDNCLAYIKPMLAKSLDDYISDIDFSTGVYFQNKYNGVRCIARLESGKVVLRSRKGEEWVSVPHINNDLKEFFAKYPNAILDGELYNWSLRQHLNKLISLVRQQDPTEQDLIDSEKMVRFYIYDGYNFSNNYGPDVSYQYRKEWINKTLPQFSKYYEQVPTTLVHSMEEVEKLYEQVLAAGEEGGIIRIPSSGYKNGRSRELLKYKPENDSEATILEIEDGDGNYAGRAKTATLDWKGKIFKATWMGDAVIGEKIFKEQKKWIGKVITFKYTGITGKNGLPEYARIDPENCFRAEKNL